MVDERFEMIELDPDLTRVTSLIIPDAKALLKSYGHTLHLRRHLKIVFGTYLIMVSNPLRDKLQELLDCNSYFYEVCADAKHHHWWHGGLNDHCCEMVGLGLDLMDLYPEDYDFTQEDLIVAVLLHDFSKIWAYREIRHDERLQYPTKYLDRQVFTGVNGWDHILDAENRTAGALMRFGVPISDRVWSAVLFAEGGYSKCNFGYAGQPTRTGSHVNNENHLAPFVHMLDLYSASILGKGL